MRVLKAHLGPQNLVAGLITLALAAGCASTTVSKRQQVTTGYLPRPAQIWVYDFAATPADIPPDSSLAGQDNANATPQTAEEIDAGRKLASQIASELVQQIREMGLSAANGSAATRPQLNDLVLEGTILSIQEGSAAKRVAIGFSSGQSEMKVAVEGLQMTPNGLRKLGSGDVSAAGNKTPGSAVGLAVLIATHNPAGLIVSTGMKVYGEKSGSSTVEGRAKQIAKEIAAALKIRFQQQGWI
jgi:Domain of unknown function (DUF4410)